MARHILFCFDMLLEGWACPAVRKVPTILADRIMFTVKLAGVNHKVPSHEVGVFMLESSCSCQAYFFAWRSVWSHCLETA